jgi:hypothetical protein
LGQRGTATRQIAENAQSAAIGTADAAGSITDVARGSSGTGAASGLLLTSGRALSDEGSRLKREVENSCIPCVPHSTSVLARIHKADAVAPPRTCAGRRGRARSRPNAGHKFVIGRDRGRIFA